MLTEATKVPQVLGVSRTSTIWIVFISPLMLFLAVAYLYPLLGIVGWSFVEPQFGLQNYERIATDQNIQAIFIRTARICFITALFSVFFAYVMAYHWIFGSVFQRKLIAISVLIPFWISVLIRAFGWLAVLRPKGIVNEMLMTSGLISSPLPLVRSELGVVVGMVHFMVPFAVFPLLSIMTQIDVRLLQAASGLGASRVRRFVEVFLPLTLPGIIGSFFIVFVFSLGFFITPAILGGGRVVMIAEYIYTQMSQSANWGLGSALAAVLLVFVAAVMWLVSRVVAFERFAR